MLPTLLVRRGNALVVATVLFLAIAMSACTSGSAQPAPRPTGDPYAWETDLSEPYPFTTPIPPRVPTPVDGVYERSLDVERNPIPCRRCAPFRLDPGEAKLTLEEGRYAIEHLSSPPGFRTAGHYVVERDRVILFNDPNCTTTRGVYQWELSDGELTLEPLDDPCPFDLLRARYLSAAAWHLRQ